LGLAKVTIDKICGKTRRYILCSGVAAYMPPHYCIVYNDVLLPNILTTVTLARPKYELPDDGRRPKHVEAF